MPLFHVANYTSWQLTCLAVVGIEAGKRDDVNDIHAELRLRQLSEVEIEQMVAFVRDCRQQPFLCMDVDDLERGVLLKFEAGLIDAAERDRRMEFIAGKDDAPRIIRSESNSVRPRDWLETITMGYICVGLVLVVLMQTGAAFTVWFVGVCLLVWLKELRPWWRPRAR